MVTDKVMKCIHIDREIIFQFEKIVGKGYVSKIIQQLIEQFIENQNSPHIDIDKIIYKGELTEIQKRIVEKMKAEREIKQNGDV